MSTNVRNFNGSSDFITIAAGGTDSGYGTYLAVINRKSDAAAMSWLCSRSAGTDIIECYASSSANSGRLTLYTGGGSPFASNARLQTASGWEVVGITKATGTATPRMHANVLSGPTWTHQNGSGTTGNASAGTGWRIGKWTDGSSNFDWTNADVFCVARWDQTVLSDANFETIVSLQAIIDLSPTNLWIFDQASTGTAVTDYTGSGADQSALTGTSAISGVTINNFDPARPATNVTVNATVAAATAAALTPVVSLGVTATAAAATAAAATPVVASAVAASSAAATAAGPAPSLLSGTFANPPAAAATAGGVAPTVAYGVSVTAVEAESVSEALAPSRTFDIFGVSWATAPAPTLVIVGIVQATIATATSAAAAVSFIESGAPTVVAAAATADSPAAAPKTWFTATVVTATADGAAPTTQTGQAVSAAATADAPAPSFIAEAAPVNVVAEIATATSDAGVATVSSGISAPPSLGFAIAWSGPLNAPIINVELEPIQATSIALGLDLSLIESSTITLTVTADATAVAYGEDPSVGYITPSVPGIIAITPSVDDDENWLTPVGPGSLTLTPA